MKEGLPVPSMATTIKKPDCAFCFPDQTQRPHFQELGVGRIDLVAVAQTDHIYAIPDILPVPTGEIHLLLVPRDHRYSLAASPELADEAGQLIYQLEQKLRKPLLVFEHGAVNEGQKKQSIFHNHAHLRGLNGRNILEYMSEVLRNKGINFSRISAPDLSPIGNLRRVFQNQGYFYLQQGKEAIIAHDLADSFPSQLGQQNIGLFEAGFMPDWKKISDNPEFAKMSVRGILSILDQCKI